jgi:hypothetical protein
VKSSESCEHPELEVVEIPITERGAYYYSQRIVGAFDEPVADSFDEIVQDLVSPIFQSANELCKKFVTRAFGL